ncbi:hypothetical protein [Halalkalibacter urbisdiaboli]|uniref:hypothetical protein n=1 Tax=Halalkalibacter urbisdiaboli TaxID=1960589 RepID=UPI000B44153E|nr:hypothetical protein [Halalkalibacter urbisdiaboli]
MDEKKLRDKLIKKARRILATETEITRVKPWNPNKIRRATNWFSSDDRVKRTIADYYKIEK